MRAPRVETIGGTSYIESDLTINNATPEVFRDCGGPPVVWNKMNGGLIGDEKYIISTTTGGGKYLNPGGRTARYIKENSPDFCCGTTNIATHRASIVTPFEVTIKDHRPGPKDINVLGTDSIQSSVQSISHTYDIPRFTVRGAVMTRMNTGNGTIVVGNQTISGVSKEEIISRFKSYLANVTDSGKSLYYYDPDVKTGGGKIQLKTWDDIYRKYSDYFVHEYEMLVNAQSSISGTLNPKGFYADGQWYEASSMGLWQTFKTRGLNDDAIKKELLDSHYTTTQINEFLKQGPSIISAPGGKGSNSSGGSGSGSGSGSRYVDDGMPSVDPGSETTITIQRSRNLFADSVDVSNSFIIKNNSEKDKYLTAPQIIQLVPAINEKWGYLEYLTNRYIFGHKPNEVQYSGLGSEWVTIDRAGGFAFVDWKKFQLLQISMSFVVAQDGDGLLQHVEEEIKLLRKIAQTPYPISFFNFDSMFSQQFRYDDEGNSRGIQFAITDLSISAQQRDKNMKVTRAQVSMTLQEVPVEKQTLIAMPRLTPKKPIKPTTENEEPPGFRLPSGANSSDFARGVGWTPNTSENG